MRIKFTKMHGLGNDFVMINALDRPLKLSAEDVRKISHRHTGIGCDQILILEPSTETDVDFNYRIINHNGTEVGQCGNGARCLGRFVHEQGLSNKTQLVVQTISTRLILKVDSIDQVRVNMGEPAFEPADVALNRPVRQDSYQIDLADSSVDVAAVSMGNPHAIQFINNIRTAPLDSQGAEIEAHPDFSNRTNVGYGQIVSRNQIKARVFERGVGETLACGSGACAIMAVARVQGLVDDKVDVDLPGGRLSISWLGEGHSLWMSGSCAKVYEGEFKLEDL